MIVKAEEKDAPAVAALALALWPGHCARELEAEYGSCGTSLLPGGGGPGVDGRRRGQKSGLLAADALGLLYGGLQALRSDLYGRKSHPLRAI